MNVHAYHLAVILNICNNIINRNLSRRTCRCGNRNNRNTLVLRRRNALQAPDIRELRILNNNTDCLGSIHGRTAADRDNIIRSRLLKSFHTGLNILNRRIRLNLRIYLIHKSRVIQDIRHLLRYLELNQIRIRADERLLKAPGLRFIRNASDCALAVIGSFIQNKSVYHYRILLLIF